MQSFDELKLSPEVARAIGELGFKTPTAIQAQALPVLLVGPCDFIGQAATGTGKTAAFGLPLIERLDPAQKHIQALVLCPTRELAVQVAGQLKLFGKYKGVKTMAVYGGAGYEEQFAGLRKEPAIVVGTPGRLIDHLERKTLDLQHVRTVVLDEADEMISMGFKEELETILKGVPREKSHFWMFSATLSPEVRRVADTYLRHPKQARAESSKMLSTTVEQVFYPVKEQDKPEILCKILESVDEFYGLVFCQTKSLVVDLTQYLLSRGYRVDSLHGDKVQKEREKTMQAFRDKKLDLLVCTDVASRGLDVKDLTHVINYTIPRELDLYVHRIGRTARGGKAGIALSLVSPAQRGLLARTERLTKSRVKEGKIPTRRDVAAKRASKILARFKAQTQHARVAEVLGEDWQAATENMYLDEIIARFLLIIAPEVFEEREKQYPLVRTPYEAKPAPPGKPHRPHGK